MPNWVDIGLKKLAVVLSKDFFAQISISQLLEDDKLAQYQTNYFDNEADAVQWLNEVQ